MKKTLATMICMTLAIGLASNALAKREKKNPPKNTREVEKILKEVGAEHFPERMKINKVGPVEVEPTYYHVFCGTLKKAGYRIIIFDNKPEYLGYYTTEFEPADYGEGEILLDSGDSDEDGNTSWFTVTIGSRGPSDKIRIDGIPTPFVKNPKLEGQGKAVAAGGGSGAIAVPKQKSASGATIDYRDWLITIQGKERTYNAIFVKKVGSKIEIKDSKRGKTATIPISAISKMDREYLKELGEL